MLRAQFVLFDGFDPLDVIAPFEVLSAGSDFLGGKLAVELVSADGPGVVRSGVSGLTLTATAAFDPDAPGYVLVPGAAGPVDGDPDADVETIPVLLSRFAAGDAMALMRHAFDNPDSTVVTVCGGSLALAMAGLLEGRTATTHVLGIDLLDATGVNAVRARVVDDGDFISGGGVTSGLDVALYVLERDFGSHTARAVEELFEYERRGVTWKSSQS
ncbi:DJ-1/PfpI family protein [Amycolatopsis circi]|uniref:DJ-1/PfpI family protein n=1 Tax=Amycolatopsis circi TaxID=871959 RepID=UPI001ABF90D9|nr:DJ-1/PfpI family protein [Amycolatopsis circi]